MMMAIQDPGTRRRRRIGRASLIACVLLIAGGGWAAAGARTDYVLLVVDSRTGEVVSRTAPGELRVPTEAGAAFDRMLRVGASGVAARLEAYARGGPAPVRASVEPLRGGPGLRIELMDLWAMPGAPPLPEVEEGV